MYIVNQQESIIYQQKNPMIFGIPTMHVCTFGYQMPMINEVSKPQKYGKREGFWRSHGVYSHRIHGTIAYFTYMKTHQKSTVHLGPR